MKKNLRREKKLVHGRAPGCRQPASILLYKATPTSYPVSTDVPNNLAGGIMKK